jgi:hypothetical protein
MSGQQSRTTLVVFWKFANDAAETDDGEDTPSGPSQSLRQRTRHQTPCSIALMIWDFWVMGFGGGR